MEVFEKETAFLKRTRLISDRPPCEFEDLLKEYRLLSLQFEKTLKQSKKVTKVGDGTQRRLLNLKKELQDQNTKIQAQKDELVQLNQRLREASLTDALTGLRNRRFLMEFIPHDMAQLLRANRDLAAELQRYFVFLILDIDFFKKVNDTYGHTAGDMVLVQMGQLLKDQCRKGDLAVRWGGEEFLLVCRQIDLTFAETLAERVRFRVAAFPFDIGQGRTLHLTCSLGFATYPFFSAVPESLLWQDVVELADEALYAAKRSRRNAWVGLSGRRNSDEQPPAGVKWLKPPLPKWVRVVTSLSEPTPLNWG